MSNDRKFCDFCKCWIADNKPVNFEFNYSNKSPSTFFFEPISLQSVSFHEGGKRHQANVAKRISELGKQSVKDERAKQKVDQQIRQMEDAAMKAYGTKKPILCGISNFKIIFF